MFISLRFHYTLRLRVANVREWNERDRKTAARDARASDGERDGGKPVLSRASECSQHFVVRLGYRRRERKVGAVHVARQHVHALWISVWRPKTNQNIIRRKREQEGGNEHHGEPHDDRARVNDQVRDVKEENRLGVSFALSFITSYRQDHLFLS